MISAQLIIDPQDSELLALSFLERTRARVRLERYRAARTDSNSLIESERSNKYAALSSLKLRAREGQSLDAQATLRAIAELTSEIRSAEKNLPALSLDRIGNSADLVASVSELSGEVVLNYWLGENEAQALAVVRRQLTSL